MIGTYVASLFLIGLSGLLLDMHRRSWRQAQQDASLTAGDLRFSRSQYRRRTQASGIIGVVGASIAIYPILPREPLPVTVYLFAISLACLAILLLAALDVWATRQNVARIRSEHLAAQVKLARDMARDEKM
jgi:hypothetical protein